MPWHVVSVAIVTFSSGWVASADVASVFSDALMLHGQVCTWDASDN